jgi:DNA-binding FadR family transcriptional regulator
VRVYDAIAAQDGEAAANAMHELVELAHEDTHSAMKD